MINFLLDCTTTKDLQLVYNIKIISKYIMIIIAIMLVIYMFGKVVYNLINHISSKKTIKNLFLSIFLSAFILLLIPFFNSLFSNVNHYKSDINYCLKFSNKEELEKSKQRDNEVQLLKESNIEEKYNELEHKILENKINEIKNENSVNKSNNANLSSTFIEVGQWGNLSAINGIFYINEERITSDELAKEQSGKYGLNTVFWERLKNLINDGKELGYEITVTVGYRPYSKYLEVWNQNTAICPTKCITAIYPGGSLLTYGVAAYLKFDGETCSKDNFNCNESATWAHHEAINYGLFFKYENEPWHIQPSKLVHSGYASCETICKEEL